MATSAPVVVVAEPESVVPKTSMATRGILVPVLTDCRWLPGGAAASTACVASAAFFGASFGPQPHTKISATTNPRRSITESPRMEIHPCYAYRKRPIACFSMPLKTTQSLRGLSGLAAQHGAYHVVKATREVVSMCEHGRMTVGMATRLTNCLRALARSPAI